MSETSYGPTAATGLVRRLSAAVRTTTDARVAPGRCAVPTDPWGAVAERCPLAPGHGGEHEVESEAAHRARLTQAAALEPTRVLMAAESVVAWLAGATPGRGARSLPVRDLWILVDVAEASALLDRSALGVAANSAEVGTDG